MSLCVSEGSPGWWRSELTPYGERVVRRKLGLPPEADKEVVSISVRGLQLRAQLPVTGEVDRETAEVLGEASEWESPPEWWWEGLTVEDLRVPASAVYRLQGRLGVKVSPLIDSTTAWHLVTEHGDVLVR